MRFPLLFPEASESSPGISGGWTVAVGIPGWMRMDRHIPLHLHLLEAQRSTQRPSPRWTDREWTEFDRDRFEGERFERGSFERGLRERGLREGVLREV